MKKIEFIKAVYNLSELPKQNLPTVVLCGRSNVGKSSFINSIFNTKMAKTSSSPGKTRSINYYLVENKFLLLICPDSVTLKFPKRNAMHGSTCSKNIFRLMKILNWLCISLTVGMILCSWISNSMGFFTQLTFHIFF